MKCPECSHQQNYSSGGMTCRKCGYSYVLNPKTDGMADGKMKHMIHKAGYGGTKVFTRDALYSAWLRDGVSGFGQKFLVSFFVSLSITIFLSIVLANAMAPETANLLRFAIFAALFIIIFGAQSVIKPGDKRSQFFDNLDQWIRAGRNTGNLIEQPSLQKRPPGWSEPDIHDYGAEAVLVVGRDILVDLFVLNGYHAESSTVVISADGYPKYIQPQVEKLMDAKPSTPVLFLHDADQSFAVVNTRANTAMPCLAKATQVIDVGIGPETLTVLPGIRKAMSKTTAATARVDMIPYLALTQGISLSAEHGKPLQALLADPKNANYDSTSTSFG